MDTDVMVDVAPNVTVYRKDGKWHWRAPPGMTKEDVIRELDFQLHRLKTKNTLLAEALAGLKE